MTHNHKLAQADVCGRVLLVISGWADFMGLKVASPTIKHLMES